MNEPTAACSPPPQPQSVEIALECRLHLLMQADLVAYKTLRDGMLAGHPGAFTSDAQTELQRDANSYRNRL
ncbi:GNAT family N-acetyltransferase, partial [Roseateles sp. GG27B]